METDVRFVGCVEREKNMWMFLFLLALPVFFFPTFLLVIQPLFSHFRTRSYGAQRQVGAYGH